MESRANSLRAYAENLLESDNTTLADEEVSGLVDDLIEFAEQWENELNNSKQPDSAAVEPYKWFNPDAKNSVINHASKFTKGAEDLYAAWSVPLYLHPPIKPPRITEQDAREIVKSWQGEGDLDAYFSYWLSARGGRTLLEKLNEHRESEPDYKAQNEIYLAALKELACLGNGGKYGNSDGNIIAQQAIAKASASTDSETDSAGILIRPQIKVE